MKIKEEQTVDGEQKLTIRGFRISYPKVIFAGIGVLVSCGILWVIMSWKKKIFLSLTHMPIHLDKAERVLLVDCYGQEFISPVERNRHSSSHSPFIFFYYKRLKYIWDSYRSEFVNVGGLQVHGCSEFQDLSDGLSSDEAEMRLKMYGANSIRIKVKPVVRLILREIWSPFYFYQAFIVLVWCLQKYYQFAICIAILSIVSVAATVWETRKQSRSLRDAMKSESVATVLRDGKEIQKPSEELVPGDVMVLSRSPFTMFCDAVLLSGNCVVNESMLTGESIPITKVPISDDPVFDPLAHKRSILSSGTEILLCRNTDSSGVKAIVFRTGFSTAKGELVRAILYPKPVKLKLYSDLLKCMFIFFIIGIPPMVYTAVVGVRLGAYGEDVLLFVLNVVTFLVPPSLPAVLTSINEQAQRRLRKQGIYCLNSRYINFSGGLDVVCFDKTGTLTEDSLDILSVVPAQEGQFELAIDTLDEKSPERVVKSLATCHSLSRIDKELRGYDMDIKMFRASGYELQEPSSGDDVPFEYIPARFVSSKFPNCSPPKPSVAIVRQFPFESSLKRMCVVTQTEGSDRFEVFLKGAPELVISLCRDKTVPVDADDVLKSYTSQGYRVIALATRCLPRNTSWTDVQKMARGSFENDLTFLGFVVLENKLKPETVPSLITLKNANIRLVMITGDNLLTAITVGKKCAIVDEKDSVIILEAKMTAGSTSESGKRLEVHYKYASCPEPIENIQALNHINKHDTYVPLDDRYHIALEGTTFNLLRMYDAELLEKVVLKGAIFARMSSENKLHLIENFQNLGYQVGMCGDGANDCGALKTAHTGVSLSMAEASVAAPFTYTRQNIQCIATLIREGRATLISTFDSFRYMVCYSFTFLLAVLFLFWDGQKPSDGAYCLIDIILNLTPPFLFGATTAYSGLAKKQPNRSILNFVPLFSVFSFMLFQVGVHTFVYKYCLAQPWYEPYTFDRENAHAPNASYSATTILTVNMMAYITGAAIFASGPPYRNTFFSNRLYVSVLMAEFVLVAYLSLYPPEFMISFLNFKRAPVISYHLALYGLSLSILVFCFIYEKFFVQRFLGQFVIPAIRRRRGPVRKYELLEKKLCDENWPAMNNSVASNARNTVVQIRRNVSEIRFEPKLLPSDGIQTNS